MISRSSIAGVLFAVGAVGLAGVGFLFDMWRAEATLLNADIKVNSRDSLVHLRASEAFYYSWTSSGAAMCQISAPTGVGGADTSGSGGPIEPSHPWYPRSGRATVLRLDCSDGRASASDSVIVFGPNEPIYADIKVNDRDGTVTVGQSEPFYYSWTSTGLTACQISSPTGVSGISLAGNDGPIPPSHPWHPATSGVVELELTCTDGVQMAVDSVIVVLPG